MLALRSAVTDQVARKAIQAILLELATRIWLHGPGVTDQAIPTGQYRSEDADRVKLIRRYRSGVVSRDHPKLG